MREQKWGGGKSPLTNEYKAVGCIMAFNDTLSTKATDADFVVIMTVYKTGGYNGSSAAIINETANPPCAILSYVGQSATIKSVVSFDNNSFLNGQWQRKITWKSNNTIQVSRSSGSGYAICVFCKYV